MISALQISALQNVAFTEMLYDFFFFCFTDFCFYRTRISALQNVVHLSRILLYSTEVNAGFRGVRCARPHTDLHK